MSEPHRLHATPSENGRRFRLVTHRILAFGELYRSTRSRDYSVGAIELVPTPDGKAPDKKTQQIEIETYQNPWKLTNLMISND